ncbi:MAG TPA: hypothetical protein VFB12_25375, partial [Ktedonobacteraceae bacterium]|nr:hypothetical protein [Ktedonobacteraceae bacterium]
MSVGDPDLPRAGVDGESAYSRATDDLPVAEFVSVSVRRSHRADRARLPLHCKVLVRRHHWPLVIEVPGCQLHERRPVRVRCVSLMVAPVADGAVNECD